jgi:hypothetical protein
MNTDPARFSLSRRTLLEVPTGQAWLVGCGTGSLWLTLDHDPRDIVLEPGEHWAVAAGQRALVYALEDAVLQLERLPAPGARGQRPVEAGPAPASWLLRPQLLHG